MARPELWPRDESEGQDAVAGWLATARRTHEALGGFLDRATAVTVPDPAGGHEGMIEFDRRRALKGHLVELGVSACVEMGRAARALASVLSLGPELPAPDPKPKRNSTGGSDAEIGSITTPKWEPLLIRMERAIARRDIGAVRTMLPGFVSLFRSEPLLYCPPSDGGKHHEVLRATAHVFEDLLTRLPRLASCARDFHLTKLARQMGEQST